MQKTQTVDLKWLKVQVWLNESPLLSRVLYDKLPNVSSNSWAYVLELSEVIIEVTRNWKSIFSSQPSVLFRFDLILVCLFS